MKDLVLASTSVYRSELLKKTGISFRTVKPLFDEDAHKKILLQNKATPLDIAEALSKGKAKSVELAQATILAGDQVVNVENKILGKSHRLEAAFDQLQILQGRTHELITAATILHDQNEYHINHVTRLTMKKLTDLEIKNYLNKDQPYDCAGSYKIEKSGIVLFDKIETDDFTAIQGIPMIWVTRILKELKYEFFQN